ALDVARQLRSEGVNVEVDISGRKFDKQLKAVIKKDIPYIVFVGADEVRDQLYTFKDTSTTDEEKLSIARIVSQVKDHRHKLADEDDELFVQGIY
ncbi:MAG: hisS, partial [Candidatus Saccharibacteria bacterium]|nr:hisS [Candidatus Saccharibacteria bacterium]